MTLFSQIFVSFVVGHGWVFLVFWAFFVFSVVVRWVFCLFVLFVFFSSGDVNEERKSV